MKHTYHVLNENTLVYSYDNKPFDFLKMLGILQGKILLGGHHWSEGTVAFSPTRDTIRKASKADFDLFGVNSKGYDLT